MRDYDLEFKINACYLGVVRYSFYLVATLMWCWSRVNSDHFSPNTRLKDSNSNRYARKSFTAPGFLRVNILHYNVARPIELVD